MARRYLLPLITLLVLALCVGGGVLYRKYLLGIAPALSVPGLGLTGAIAPKGRPFSYPQEFDLQVFAEGLSTPRVIAFDAAGTMLVSMPSTGMVAALPDADADGRADRIVPVAEGLNRPHGIAFRCEADECRLYIAETDRVRVFDYDRNNFKARNGRTLVDLPGGGRHVTRTLLFLPPPEQDKLLVAVGSSCDTCAEEDWRRAKILLAEGEGKLRTFAAGLRNTVFMRIHPGTKEVWATGNGPRFSR